MELHCNGSSSIAVEEFRKWNQPEEVNPRVKEAYQGSDERVKSKEHKFGEPRVSTKAANEISTDLI